MLVMTRPPLAATIFKWHSHETVAPFIYIAHGEVPEFLRRKIGPAMVLILPPEFQQVAVQLPDMIFGDGNTCALFFRLEASDFLL